MRERSAPAFSQRALGAGTAFALLACFAFGARAQELVAPIVVNAEIRDPSTRRATEAVSGAPLILTVGFHDALLDRPAALTRPTAFLRPLSAADEDCAELARARRATGVLARGDIALDGYYLVLLSQEGRIAVVDPQMSIATSNILRVIDPGEPPRALAVDAHGAIYASLPARNVLAQIDPASGAVTPVEGLPAPAALAPLGAGVAAVNVDGEAHFLEAGKARTLPLPFAATGVRAGAKGTALFSDAAGRLALIAPSGALRGVLMLGAPPRDFAYSAAAEAALTIVDGASEATISFIDGSTPLRLPLPHAADAVFMSPDGRHAIVAHRDSGAASIIDMAFGQVVQAVAFEQALADVRFTDRSIVFLLAGRQTGALLPRSTIAKGRPSALRRIPLGGTADTTSNARDASLQQIAAETVDRAGVLVLSPARDAVLRVNDAGLHENLSLASIALKGDRPRTFFVAPRGLRNVGRGRFEALVSFARGAPHRLVALDDSGALLGCRDIAVKPNAAELARARKNPEYALAISSLRRTDAGLEIDFTLDAAGAPAPAIRAIVAQGLATPWRAVAPAQANGENFRAVITRTSHAPFALYAVLGSGAHSRPLVVEKTP